MKNSQKNNSANMEKALQEALKRVEQKEPQFKVNTDQALAKRKVLRK